MLDRVAQLAHVAVPRPVLQLENCFLREHRRCTAKLPGKMLCQQRNILRPLAQRRQVDLERAQPKEQIVSKLARLDHLPQVLMRRRNDAKPRPHGRIGAHWQHFAMIQHAQQLQLQRGRHIGHLVEKQRARRLPATKVPCDFAPRRCNAPSTCPNNSASANDGLSAPMFTATIGTSLRALLRWIASAANSLPTPLSPCSRTDGIRVGRERNLLEHSLHRRRLPQHTLNRRRRGDLGTAEPAQRSVDRGANLGQIERLHHVFERTLANRLDRRRQIAERRDHDDRRPPRLSAEKPPSP